MFGRWIALALLLGQCINAHADDDLNNHPVCARVARLESDGRLQSTMLTGKVEHLTETVEREVRETDRTSIQVDINNDGHADNVVIDRTLNYGTSFRLSDSKGNPFAFHGEGESESNPELDDFKYYVHRVGVIRDHGTNFLVIWQAGVFVSRNTMDSVLRIDSDNVAHETCAFQGSSRREHRARKGSDPVCRAIVERRVEYPAFDVPVSAKIKDEMDNVEIKLRPDAARVDIDNDGSVDLIGIAYGESALSDDCGWARLERLSGDGASVVATSLDDPLRMATNACGDIRVLPVRFRGQTFIDKRPEDGSPWETHAVYQFKGNELSTVCVIDVLRKYEALTEYEVFVKDYPDDVRLQLSAALERKDALEKVRLLDRHSESFRRYIRTPEELSVFMSDSLDAGRVDVFNWFLARACRAWQSTAEGRPDAEGLVAAIVQFSAAQPRAGNAAARDLSRCIGSIPEGFVDYGIEGNPGFLADLAGLGLPVDFAREESLDFSEAFARRFGPSTHPGPVSEETWRALKRLERNSHRSKDRRPSN